VFVANPSWAGDTLAFVPYRVRDVELGLPATLPASHAEAIRKQRQMVRRIAATWRAAFPRSSDAMLALALASDDLGDPGALDSLRVARQLATDSGERLRAGAAEVWVEVKRSVPRNLDGLNAARVLADSLVSQISPSDVRQSDAVASLAALTGRLSAGVAAARHFGPTSDPGTRRLIEHGRALQVFAALGGPQDSIRALERAVEDDIQQSVGVAMREGAQVEWRLRAMTLAFPTWPSPRVRDFASIDDLARAQASSLQHDTATVLRVLDSLRIRRRVIAPEVLKLEALYPEASLLRAVGARADAVQWVGPTLESMEKVSPQALSTAIGTASLVRSMILRAELAEESGDHRSAAMWARAVVTLWANADPSLQPVVERMKRLF